MSFLSNINATAFVVVSLLCCLIFNACVYLWFRFFPSESPIREIEEREKLEMQTEDEEDLPF